VDENDIENHPDLMNPDWQKYAEREAWASVRQDRRRGKGRTTAVVAAVVLVAAGAAVYLWARSEAADSSASLASYGPGPSGVRTPSATAPAPTDLPSEGSVDLARPYDNTPAQNWREGIDGLDIAPATKVGSFSAEQVRGAEDQVKQAVTIAQFEPEVQEQHRPDKYVGLFAPDARADLKANLSGYTTEFATGYHLLSARPRMSGTLTVKPGKDGELVLHVAYVVAYAFDPGHAIYHGPGGLVPFVRVDSDYILRVGKGWGSGSRGLWNGSGGSFYSSVGCTAAKAGLVAPAFSEPGYPASSAAREPGRFDPAKPMPTNGNCDK